MPDGNIYADSVFALLVEYRVERNGGLARLTVSDDQLTLSAADREHGIYRKKPGLHRLIYRLTLDDAGRRSFDRVIIVGGYFSVAIDGLSQRIDYTPEEPVAHGNARRLFGPSYLAALNYLTVIAEDDTSYLCLAQIKDHALDAALKQYNLTVFNADKSVKYRDTVADRKHGAYFIGMRDCLKGIDRLPDERYNIVLPSERVQYLFLKLTQFSLRRPVEYRFCVFAGGIPADLKPEALADILVLLPYELYRLTVSSGKIARKPRPTLIRRLPATVKECDQLILFGGAHMSRPLFCLADKVVNRIGIP